MFETYTRKPRPIVATQLTEENLEDVAILCGGMILERDRKDSDEKVVKYLRVPHVVTPFNLFVGDYLTREENGRFTRGPKELFESEYEKKTPVVRISAPGGTPFVHESGLPGMPGSFPGDTTAAVVRSNFLNMLERDV